MLGLSCTLFIFFLLYWLCVVPAIIFVILKFQLVKAHTTEEFVWVYGVVFISLCVLYVALRNLLENCYTSREIRRRLRRLIARQQLEKLERGEIELSGLTGGGGEWWERVSKTEKLVELNVKKLQEREAQIIKMSQQNLNV